MRRKVTGEVTIMSKEDLNRKAELKRVQVTKDFLFQF